MINNLFRNLNASIDKPLVSTLIENRNIKIERVIASGHASEKDVFCKQEDNDLLILLQGSLALDYEEGRIERLNAGDFIFTLPKQNNRIEDTSSDEEALWLKISFHGKTNDGLFPSPDLRKIKDRMKRNIFRNTAKIESLVESKNVRIERVVSVGDISPAGACKQDFNEVIFVLKGQTILEIGEEKTLLSSGDYTTIPSGVPNRVNWTTEGAETIWVAVYFIGQMDKGKYPFQTGY